MWVSWWLSVGWACEPVALDDVSVEPGAVTVLGERHGRKADLDRARSLVRAAAGRGPVTVALEAVSADHQDVLDRLSAGEIRAGRVRRLADWSETWGYPFRPYRRILRIDGVRYVAAGPRLGPKPEGAEVAVPDVYEARLADVAERHGSGEPGAVRKFAEAMAWRDFRIAELALEGWDRTSALVVIAGRGHVQGGLGITWQFDEGLTDARHQRVLLAPSPECEVGDLVLGSSG